MTILGPAPLTQADLNGSKCAIAGCTHDTCDLTLRGRCHPGAPADVKYIKARGVLVLTCSRCYRSIAEVAVAA